MTEEKRMVLPPGTRLVLTPTLAMPLLRYPPDGIDANLTISTPYTSIVKLYMYSIQCNMLIHVYTYEGMNQNEIKNLDKFMK